MASGDSSRETDYKGHPSLLQCLKCGTFNLWENSVCSKCERDLQEYKLAVMADMRKESPEPVLQERASLVDYRTDKRETGIRRIADAMERNATATERIFTLMLVLTIIGFLSGIAVLVLLLP